MPSTRVRQMIDDIIEREGGFSNNPDDPGGETMYGITEAVARRNGYDGLMQDMTRDFAFVVYLNRYYHEPKFERVAAYNPMIAEELTDTGVNMGITVAVKFLQRSLNALNQDGGLYRDLIVDGYIGQLTLAALGAYLDHRNPEGGEVLLKALNCLQGARYIGLAEKNKRFETFVYGWLRTRVEL